MDVFVDLDLSVPRVLKVPAERADGGGEVHDVEVGRHDVVDEGDRHDVVVSLYPRQQRFYPA